MSLPPETFDRIADAAVSAVESEPYVVGESLPDFVTRVVPAGARVDTVDFTKWRKAPVRRTGSPTFHTPLSFAEYISVQSIEGTALYADVKEERQIVAVIDGHENAGGAPGWGQHRASLVLRPTVAWKRWTAKSGIDMDPEDFAEFLEDNAPDVVSPDAATLTELARTLDIHKDVSYVNVTRQTTGGRRLHYEETVTARAGESGQIDIPETLTLALAPWDGVDRFAVTAKFRFRLRGGKLTLSFVLVRPEAVLGAAFFGTPEVDPPIPGVLTVVEAATGLTALHGRP